MLIIKRIGIKEGQGHCGDKVYPFVSQVLKRRYGNAVTFCFDYEVEKIINQFKEAGFTAYDDNYTIKLTEPKDFKIDNIVYVEGMFGNIPIIVKEIKEDSIHGIIAKVKYQQYPRKHAIWIKVKSQNELESEIGKYGQGMIEEYYQEKK